MGRLARIALHLLFLVGFASAGLGEVQAAEVAPAPYAGRWIDVNLTSLRITAFQGARAVYSAPVTTGKRGYLTPTGTYSVVSRVRVQDMESLPGSREYYYVKNVQYVQYFRYDGFSLHANYWSPLSAFGRWNTSHGCVGMTLGNARYFWNFASLGTPVYVHYGKTSAVTPVVRVDSVAGKSLPEARAKLQATGLKVAVRTRTTMLEEPGTVLAQSPAGGRTAGKGSTVTLTVAEARALQPVRVPSGDFAWAPDVVGLRESDAVARIEEAGLRAVYVNYFDEKSAPVSARKALLEVKKGAVFASPVASGSQLLRGSELSISVRRP